MTSAPHFPTSVPVEILAGQEMLGFSLSVTETVKLQAVASLPAASLPV